MFPLLALLAVGFVVYKVSQSSGTSSEPINRQTPNGAGNRQPGEGPQYGPDYQPGTADDQYTGPGSQSESFQDLTGAFWTITRVNGLNNVYLWNGQTTSYGGKNFTQASRSLLISEIQKLAAEVYGPDHMPGTADDQYTGPGTQSESFPDRAGALWTITRLAGVNYGVPGYFWNGQTTSYGGKTFSKTTRDALIAEIQNLAAESGSSDGLPVQPGLGGISFAKPSLGRLAQNGIAPPAKPVSLGVFASSGLTLLTRVNAALAKMPADIQETYGSLLRLYAIWKRSWSEFPYEPVTQNPDALRATADHLGPYGEDGNVIAGFLRDLAAKIDLANAPLVATATYPTSSEPLVATASVDYDALARANWPALTSPPVSTDPAYGPALFDLARRVHLQTFDYDGELQTNLYPNEGMPTPDRAMYDGVKTILEEWKYTHPTASYAAARAELQAIFNPLGAQLSAASLPEVGTSSLITTRWRFSPDPSKGGSFGGSLSASGKASI